MTPEPSLDVSPASVELRRADAAVGVSGQRQSFDAEVLQAAARLGVAGVLNNVFEMTAALFPGSIEIRVDDDPEIADDTRLLFMVQGADGPGDVVDLELEWIHQLRRFGSAAFVAFCVTITPRQ
ncbi:MAG TPA: hypothetical protein VMV69_25795 [Pirellulales bacterium]|nr:hypothetical protein [Pirellulales bacterium]